MDGPWHVLLLKNQGLRPTLVFRDANNRVYLLRFDPRGAPELATGAEMISSRFFHALGYYVPETYLACSIASGSSSRRTPPSSPPTPDVRPLLPEHIDRFLDDVARRSDRRYRAVALRVPTDGVSLVGPYQLFGTRSDDPNDIVPHEHRRDLRGLQVFSAWLNHARMDALHTFDIVVQPPGQPPHIRHYLFDFMATLGSGINGPKGGVGGPGSDLRTGRGAPQHLRPRPLHAGLDAREVPGSAGGRLVRFRDVRAGEVDQRLRRGAVRQPSAGRRILGRPAGGGVYRRRYPRHRAGRAVLRPEGRTVDRGLPDRAAQPHRAHLLRDGPPARRYRRPRR